MPEAHPHLPEALVSALPLVAAPMAGVTTLELMEACAAAGAFVFLPAGYRNPEDFAAQLDQARALEVPFGANLFVPSTEQAERARTQRKGRSPHRPLSPALQAYAEALEPEFERFGLPLPQIPSADADFWEEKLEILIDEPVPAVSFTFGLPGRDVVSALQKAGSAVVVSVTSVDEAAEAAEAGADALVVQGPRAGGHSAAWTPQCRIEDVPAAQLVAQVRSVVDLPIIAAGGVDGSEAVRELLHAGASSAAVGTLLLRSEEAGTSQVHKDALASPEFTTTQLTCAFTGRPARGLLNGFMEQYGPFVPQEYPAVHHLTKPLRTAAAAEGDAHGVHLWAGTGWRHAQHAPAQEIIAELAAGL